MCPHLMRKDTDTMASAPPDPAPSAYDDLLTQACDSVTAAHTRAQRAVNAELVQAYWRIGRLLLAQQDRDQDRDTGLVTRFAADLRAAHPTQRGFSRRNLTHMRKLARVWPGQIARRPVAQLPWGHVVVLMERLETRAELEFYAAEAVRHGWSRADLDRAIREHRHRAWAAAAPPDLDVRLPEGSPAHAELAGDPFRLDFLRLDGHGHGVDAAGPGHR
ncbi:DUF1016 N-terminal domain-containing protein [Streptomyces flavofungini]|uniref:DUF1016 N-terminal domain-containing protein n=1 Tax=Streptomyces flavofungini TaxID=68200 RepID=UPI0025B053B7|nr:DUF1016 N-terminal domain-containing protein [Streptomyces flavofungini]WJV47036.1 DUF1016 N-terminal domain-containing protein [Streptomyces flavofungini]